MKLDKEGGLLPEIAAFGGCRLPPRAAQKHARTCKKLPVASFCASETAETGRIANGREQGDHVSRRQESYKGGKAAGNVPQSGENCCGRQKKAAERQKNLILFVRICFLGVLIRGLEKLESPVRERFYSFRLYEKNGEYPRGLRPSGLRGAIQISARFVIFAEMTGQHHVTSRVGNCKLSEYRR